MSEKKTKMGPFSSEENDYITRNYIEMTDKELAAALNRTVTSIANRRRKMGLIGAYKQSKGKNAKRTSKQLIAEAGDDTAKLVSIYRKEVMDSYKFRTAQKAFTQDEQEYYIEQYVDFMMDPNIETMTSAEKSTLHNKIYAEIQLQRYMLEEKKFLEMIEEWKNNNDNITIEDIRNMPTISRSREIKECQETIMKYNRSLNSEREQRLKGQNDQSVTFVNLLKEMKNPQNRQHLGLEASI